MTIQLIEDNAGGLFIGSENGPWYEMTELQQETMFADDAEALAEGDAVNWTVDVYTERPMGDVVATWNDGTVKICGHFGRAANEYTADKSGEDY